MSETPGFLQHKVGAAVAVVVTCDGKFLTGKRKMEDGQSCWQLPGGWIEPGESPQQAASREVKEETGLDLKEMELVAITNNIFSPQEHSISLCFEAECIDKSTLRSTSDCKDGPWMWKEWSQVTQNLFLPFELLRQTEYQPFFRNKRKTQVSF
ncbi:MAG: NUDIX domain-containing protein [Pseudomonadota bacterium]